MSSDEEESDGDIVLDQSLAKTIGPRASNRSTSGNAQPTRTLQPSAARSVVNHSLKPSTASHPGPLRQPAAAPARSVMQITIAPPTLKSNKNAPSDSAQTPLAPPLPFHAQLAKQTRSEPALHKEAEEAEEDGGDDDIVRPQVDPALLRLMNADGADVAEHSFLDLSVGDGAKPWSRKGVDITDWFNYGFNERTWRAYCCAQASIRRKQVQPPQPPQPMAPTHSHSHAQAAVVSHGVQPYSALPPPPKPYHAAQPVPPPPSNPYRREAGEARKVVMGAKANMGMLPGICFDFQNKGHCLRGASCRWAHEKREGADERDGGRDSAQGVCFDFENKGSCSYGSQCRWRHLPRGGAHANQGRKTEDTAQTTDQLQKRLRLILGETPNIPAVVSNLLNDEKSKKRKRRKKKHHKKKRGKRSRSRSRSSSRSVSRSRSRD